MQKVVEAVGFRLFGVGCFVVVGLLWGLCVLWLVCLVWLWFGLCGFCFFLITILILFLLPAGNSDLYIIIFLGEVYTSYSMEVYLHCTNVILLCGIEIWFRMLFKEMIGNGSEHPVVSG